jgi:large subunit ribosomal protein L25
MEAIKIEAKKRTIQGKANNAMRRGGTIPAVMYGKHQEPVSLELPESVFGKMYARAGESTLIDLTVDGKSHKVLVQDVARDALTDRIIHADFHAVSLTEKLHTKIPLAFVGESKAVKGLGGILVKSVDELDVECLPQDLVHEIPVDISTLVNFGDFIRLKNVTLPPGIAVQHLHGEDVIATVTAPRSEEEIAALETKPVEAVGEVEVIKKEKAEEGEEGAVAAGEPAAKEAPAKKEEKKK